MLNGRVVAVNLTVEIGGEGGGGWGEDCTIKQAYEQGTRDAEDLVRKCLAGNPRISMSSMSTARVVVDAPKKERS